MLSADQLRFLAVHPVGHLATADSKGVPHVVPVCFAVAGATLYITIDEKPKRNDRPVKRLRNIAENPAVAIVVDRYDETWSELAWIMLRGQAEILTHGPEHGDAQALLRRRYPQLGPMRIEHLPVIAIRIGQVTEWGNLSPPASFGSAYSQED
jgi:PPOX class probable F420-dependent enzyme